MMNKTESTESTEVREVTVRELVAAFEGKYVNVSPLDHYGIAIEIHKGTIEFEDDLEHLHFHEEYPLGTQPMRMDILIIKKDPDVHIRKNIGQIFRTYNVIEYKPPGVSLSINHFYKAYGYACFFQSDTEKEV